MNTGYLISPGFGELLTRFSWWNHSWTLSNQLSMKYGMQHVMLGPPLEYHADHRTTNRLDTNLTFGVQSKRIPRRFRSSNGSVIVQKVRNCLWPSCLLLGCIPKKKEYFRQHLDGFLASVPFTHRGSMLRHLAKNLNTTNALLTAVPCLRVDFQAFIDADGAVLHLDLDRCFEPQKQWLMAHVNTERCFAEALANVSRGVRLLET